MSNKIKASVIGKLPITLEGVQLALQNAERLFYDSQNVSIPTKVALLEIGLEEVAKAWGLALSFEDRFFKKNPGQIEIFLNSAHIKRDKYNKTLKKIEKSLEEFFSENDPALFMTPFDTKTFSEHDAKIDFLSKFIRYVREIQLPLLRESSDRVKVIREILGRYISKTSLSNIEENDDIIDDILNVDDKQLGDIIKLKEDALYLGVQNDVFLSPSSRSYETKTLENLLALLIGMVKNELSLLFIVLKKKSVKITAKK